MASDFKLPTMDALIENLSAQEQAMTASALPPAPALDCVLQPQLGLMDWTWECLELPQAESAATGGFKHQALLHSAVANNLQHPEAVLTTSSPAGFGSLPPLQVFSIQHDMTPTALGVSAAPSTAYVPTRQTNYSETATAIDQLLNFSGNAHICSTNELSFHEPVTAGLAAAAATAADTCAPNLLARAPQAAPARASNLATAGSLDSSATNIGDLSFGCLAGPNVIVDQDTYGSQDSSARGRCAGCQDVAASIAACLQGGREGNRLTPAAIEQLLAAIITSSLCVERCLPTELPNTPPKPGDWWLSLSKARAAEQGRQRARAGTSLPRNFNWHANAPTKCCIGNSGPFYSVKSTVKALTGLALLRPASATTASAEGALGVCQQTDSTDSMWIARGVTCRKSNHPMKGMVFDLYKLALFYPSGQKDNAAREQAVG